MQRLTNSTLPLASMLWPPGPPGHPTSGSQLSRVAGYQAWFDPQASTVQVESRCLQDLVYWSLLTHELFLCFCSSESRLQRMAYPRGSSTSRFGSDCLLVRLSTSAFVTSFYAEVSFSLTPKTPLGIRADLSSTLVFGLPASLHAADDSFLISVNRHRATLTCICCWSSRFYHALLSS